MLLVFIVIFGFLLRLYGLNWDSGFHFHPDERMLIMVADRVRLFTQMNPDFFNYGSLPIYILTGTSQLLDALFKLNVTNYDGMLFVGRSLSTFTDLLVIILVYKIANLLFKNKSIALWGAFFYAIAFFPIQNSHFFVVDVYLNLFITTLLYLLLLYYDSPSWKKIIFIGVVYAAALTTKVSAIIFMPVILFVLMMAHAQKLTWWKKIISHFKSIVHYDDDTSFRKFILVILLRISIFSLFFLIFSFLFMPYAFIESDRFTKDILMQTQMNSDPYIFPYTLQYVGTTPYFYYLQNIFLWGIGPFISMFAVIGLVDQIIILRKYWKTLHVSANTKVKKLLHVLSSLSQSKLFIFYIFYLLYFAIIGKSAVKFMRYMLLMYPFFILLAGYGMHSLSIWLEHNFYSRPYILVKKSVVILVCVLWTIAFVSIYRARNTRVRATDWINRFIPAGSTLAVEHWDDRVPIYDPGKYKYVEMTLYERPDDDTKWELQEDNLRRADYIIIASNRLYVPLQRLNDCSKYKFCFPKTAQYYQDLFAGRRDFMKIAEFTSYPQLRIFDYSLTIVDDIADESFTVYDHPKVMIFKKI